VVGTMGIPEGFTIRRTDDVATMVAHRRGMFYDMGYHNEAALDSMSAKFQPWVLAKMKSGDYFGWLVVDREGSVVASAGLWLMDWPPHMVGSGTRRGYILNVYTEREFRRRGLSRRLMEVIVEWCRGNGIDTVVLHASSAGRALYESLGFTATNEMRIML
jgi:GNAT superfamily N-acetyltransferase